MKIKRRSTRSVNVGGIKIGGGAPISIQSMAKTDTRDVSATVKEIKALTKAGCEIVRLAVEDMEAARVLKEIKRKTDIPLVADIHFNYRFALEAIKNGIDKVRLNPGNISRPDDVRAVVEAAKKRKIPIRIGVNSGSVAVKGKPSSAVMVAAAQRYISLLERFDFRDIVISLKSSDVVDTLDAYRRLAAVCDYPFHLGITATGAAESGIIKSTLGIGTLLSEGIGDTIRVSLTSAPEDEVRVAREMLQALNLRRFGYDIIACPTCGRCEVDVIAMTNALKKRLNGALTDAKGLRSKKIAIMGCFVNGPGEAREADIGIAFGKNYGLVFKKGKIIKKLPVNRCIGFLEQELLK